MASLLDDNGNYKNMSYAQFKDYVLGGRTESDFDADFMYFNFQNGNITDMFQSDVRGIKPLDNCIFIIIDDNNREAYYGN